METTSIRGVELISAGMKWPSANGELTITMAHIADAAAAAEDPHIQPPRLKIGHSDPRFNDLDHDHDPFALIGDGEPAVGSVRNIRIANEGSMLVGDYVDVPVWLAEAMPTAYPSRSIEGGHTVVEGAAGEPIGTWDVETPGGKHYSFVLTACALLGVVGPAILNLDDLRLWLTEGKGLVVAGSPPFEGSVPVDASTVSGMLIPEMSAPVESIVDDFCSSFAPTPDDQGYWWWPVDMWADGGTLYVDDDEGGIRAVPYTTDADQNVAWGEPQKVVQRYEPAPAAASIAAALHPGSPDVVFRNVEETPLASRHAGRTKSGGAIPAVNFVRMDLTDSQRSRLAVKFGLAEDADETAIAEALDADTVDTPDDDTAVKPDDKPAADDKPDVALSTTTVTVDKDKWDATQAELSRLSKVADKIDADERTGVLDAAIASGKIMPSSRDAWALKLSAAREATEAEIASLAEGLVPTSPVGHSKQTVEASADDAVATYMRQHFPDIPVQTNQEGVTNG